MSAEINNLFNSLPFAAETLKFLAISFSGFYFAHIQYIPKAYLESNLFKIDDSNILRLSQYAKDASSVPDGARIVRKIMENQLPNEWSLTQTKGKNWYADVHTDGPYSFSSGGLPEKAVMIPDSVNMTREEAIQHGIKLGLFFK